MTISPIRSDDDHKAALSRIEALWGSPAGTAEADELDVLVVLVEDFEGHHYPVGDLEPVPFLLFHMEATGRTQADLGHLFGSAPRASEVLRRRRSLSKEMILSLQESWGIPATILIKPYAIEAKGKGATGDPSLKRTNAGSNRRSAA
jgi:HTH-type transcriptional regulator / antitoxin HigA